MRVLVVEDHPKLARLLTRALTEEGYRVEVCSSAEGALEEALRGRYDLLALGALPMVEEQARVIERLRRYGAPILHVPRSLQIDALCSQLSRLTQQAC